MEADEELATYIAEAVWDRLEAVEAARPCKTEREVEALIWVMKKYR